MSFQTGATAQDLCLKSEMLLEDVAGGLYPANLETRTFGFYEAIQNSTRSTPVSRFQDMTDEKAKPGDKDCKRYTFRYKQKRCAPIGDCPSLCEDGTPNLNQWLHAEPIIGDPLCAGFSLSHDDYRCLCEGRADYYLEELRTVYETLHNAINIRWTEQFAAGVGNYPLIGSATDCADAVNSATAPEILCLFNDTTNKPQPQALFKLRQYFKRMGYSGSPTIVGGQALDYWNFNKPLFAGNDCGNDANRGQQLTNTFIDYDIYGNLDTKDECLFAFAPGAVFPLWWRQYSGDNEYFSDTRVRRSFDLGRAVGKESFLVDLDITVNEKAGTDCEDIMYNYRFKVCTDLCKMPQDAFSEDCGQCFNYCLKFLVDCCPTDCNDWKCP